MDPIKKTNTATNIVHSIIKNSSQEKKDKLSDKIEDILSKNGYGGRVLKHRPYDKLPFITIEIKKGEDELQIKKNITDILRANGAHDGINNHCDAVLDGVKIFIAPDNLVYI